MQHYSDNMNYVPDTNCVIPHYQAFFSAREEISQGTRLGKGLLKLSQVITVLCASGVAEVVPLQWHLQWDVGQKGLHNCPSYIG